MNKVKINNLEYTIEEVDEIGKSDDGGTYSGQIDYIDQKILILKRLSKEQKKNTLRHELTHAFLWAYGFAQMESLHYETICDFVGIYSEQIVKIANEYIEKIKEEV